MYGRHNLARSQRLGHTILPRSQADQNSVRHAKQAAYKNFLIDLIGIGMMSYGFMGILTINISYIAFPLIMVGYIVLRRNNI